MTQRDEMREVLEAVGFKFSAGGGDRFWIMVSPSESFACLIGRNGGLRRTRRTARGFPRSGSVNLVRPGETGPDAARRIAAATGRNQ